jgi:hypothetical protein
MGKKLLAILVLVMVASLSVAGCTIPNTASKPSPTPLSTPNAEPTVSTPTETFSSGAGYNITYPKTLKINSTTNASAEVMIYIYLATNNTIDAVNVATYGLSSNDTLADFMTRNVAEMSKFPNYRQISTQSTTLAGKPAYTLVWQATVPVQMGSDASIRQNTTLKLTQTLVINNNKGYIVTYKAIPSDYDKYLAQAQQIMNSFEFNSRSSL